MSWQTQSNVTSIYFASREATDFFGDLLLPHVMDIVRSNAKKPLDETEQKKIGPIVAGAVITTNGKLAPNFEYIAK